MQLNNVIYPPPAVPQKIYMKKKTLKSIIILARLFCPYLLKPLFLQALPPRMAITLSDNAKQTQRSSRTCGDDHLIVLLSRMRN